MFKDPKHLHRAGYLAPIMIIQTRLSCPANKEKVEGNMRPAPTLEILVISPVHFFKLNLFNWHP